LLEAGGGSIAMQPHAIKKLAGHSSVRTTIRNCSTTTGNVITAARVTLDHTIPSQQPAGMVKLN